AQRLSLWMELVASVAIVIGVRMSIRAYIGGRLATDVLNPISIGAAGVSLYLVSTSLTAHRKALPVVARALGAFAGVALCLLSASKGPLLELLGVLAVQLAIPGRPLGSAQKARHIATLLTV